MEKLCLDTGFKEVEIIPYFRATDYFAFFFPAFIVVSVFENIFEFFNLKIFANAFIIKANKKENVK